MTVTWDSAPPITTTAFSMAQTLLQLLNASAASLGVVLPERQFVYPSPVPADCEQAAVLVENWSPNPPLGDQLDQCWATSYWVVKFGVIISRLTCAVPVGKTAPRPTAASMTEAMRIASDDAEVFRDLISRLPERGQLDINFHAPAGMIQTTELLLTLRADGTL